MQEKEHFRSAFLDWIDATRAGKASSRDRWFRDTSGKEFPTAYLMGHMATNTDALPEGHGWIVTDNAKLIGQHAERSYENAVRVVRAQRQQ
jgi:hypothetical protein